MIGVFRCAASHPRPIEPDRIDLISPTLVPGGKREQAPARQPCRRELIAGQGANLLSAASLPPVAGTRCRSPKIAASERCKTMVAPSGDHTGSSSCAVALGVICCLSVPSGLIVQI